MRRTLTSCARAAAAAAVVIAGLTATAGAAEAMEPADSLLPNAFELRLDAATSRLLVDSGAVAVVPAVAAVVPSDKLDFIARHLDFADENTLQFVRETPGACVRFRYEYRDYGPITMQHMSTSADVPCRWSVPSFVAV